MPYVYEVSFDIDPKNVGELEVGNALERTSSYLKARLPGRHGFISGGAEYSVDDPNTTRIVFRSEWSDWEDVENHRDSTLLEDKVLQEFNPNMNIGTVSTRVYAKVGSGPLRYK